jgi:hypothetical protein
MPTDYTVIHDGAVSLPKDNGDIDTDFKFGARGLDDSIRPVLLYRINPDPDPNVSLEINVNGTSLGTASFGSDPERGWVEVIPSGVLQESGNILTLTKTGDGSVKVSNLLVMFQTS